MTSSVQKRARARARVEGWRGRATRKCYVEGHQNWPDLLARWQSTCCPSLPCLALAFLKFACLSSVTAYSPLSSLLLLLLVRRIFLRWTFACSGIAPLPYGSSSPLFEADLLPRVYLSRVTALIRQKIVDIHFVKIPRYPLTVVQSAHCKLQSWWRKPWIKT